MMPSYKAKQADKVFTKLQIQEGSSNHHRRGFLIDETTGIRLYPPIYFNKGCGDIYPRIARKLRVGLRLKEVEFDELMCCRMSRSEYFAVRRTRDEG